MTTPTKAMTDETRRLTITPEMFDAAYQAYLSQTRENRSLNEYHAAIYKAMRALEPELRSAGREYVSVPRDFLVKVDDALQRALDDRAPRRIPVDAADADILQVEIRKLLTAAPPAPNRDAEDARRYRYCVAQGMIDGFIEGYLSDNDLDEAGYPDTPEYKLLADKAIDAALAAAPEREGSDE